MSSLFPYVAGCVLAATALAALAVRHPPGWVRWSAVLLAAATAFLFYHAGITLLGQPRPTQMPGFAGPSETVEVIAHRLVPGRAIYVWVVPETASDEAAPLALSLPWDSQRARELHEANRQAEEDGAALHLSLRAERRGTDPQEPLFYPAPVPPNPPKQDYP